MRNNTRIFPRHKKRLRFSFRSRGNGKWNIAYSKDISTHGVFLMSGKLPTRDIVELDVQVDNQKMTLEARVVWGLRAPARLQQLAKGGFGLKLTKVPEEWQNFCLSLDGLRGAQKGA